MNNKKILLISTVVLIGVAFYVFQDKSIRKDVAPSAAEDHQGDSVEEQSGPPPVHGAYPGQVTDAPRLEAGIRAGLAGMLDTSSEGLEEEEVDGTGAVSINLQGRFRTAPVATIDEGGEIHIEEYSFLPDEKSQ